MMNGRGAMRATQRTGSSRGPAMMTFAIAAATARSGANRIVRRIDKWSAETDADHLDQGSVDVWQAQQVIERKS